MKKLLSILVVITLIISLAGPGRNNVEAKDDVTSDNLEKVSQTVLADDEAGYVMSYFVQTGSWTEQYPIRLAFSYDGLNWIPLNDGEPVIKSFASRDPHIFKKDDGTFVILTTGYGGYINVIDSPDLCTFSEPRSLYVGPSNCMDTWAPEGFRDPSDGKYMIVFTGKVSGESNHSLYYAKTSDFITCTTTGEFLYKEGTADTIDGSIIQDGSTFYMYYKNDDTNKTKVVKSTSATGNYTSFMTEPLTTVLEDQAAEGAFVIKALNQNKWYLYYDLFMNNGHWGCKTTTNLGSTTRSGWTKLEENVGYKVPVGARHGNAIAVTQAELDKVKSYWQHNLIRNGSFDDGGATQTPVVWSEWNDTDASYTETTGSNPGLGSTNKLSHYRIAPFNVSTYQNINLPNGSYTIIFYTCRSEGAASNLVLKGYGGADIWQPTESNSIWHKERYTVNVTTGNLQIGFSTQTTTNSQWSCFDDVFVTKQNLIKNGSFDDEGATQTPGDWSEWNDINASYTDTTGSNPGLGSTCKLSHYRTAPFNVSTYQDISLPNGNYTISFYTCRSKRAASNLVLKGYGGADIWQPTESNSIWHKERYTVNVTTGNLQIGFSTQTTAIFQWSCFDDVSVTKN